MARKRNHYIPQFLLRRFASRAARKRHWVWQLRSGQDPVEILTKGAAVSTYFYGHPETGVEDTFARLENRQAALLRGLDAGADPNERSQDLRAFIWSLAFRTRSLRGHFEQATQRAIDHMKAVDPRTITAALRHAIGEKFDCHMDSVVAGLPPAQQALLRQVLKLPGMSDALKNYVLTEVSTSTPLVNALLEQASDAIPEAAASGHVNGLIKLFAEGKAVPGSFLVPHWTIVRFDASAVVLGDGVVFAVGPEGGRGALGRFTKDYAAVYAPIAHDSVLVGKRDPGMATLDLDDINATSAELSFDTLFASRISDAERALVNSIGRGEPVISDQDLASIATESWESLGRPPRDE